MATDGGNPPDWGAAGGSVTTSELTTVTSLHGSQGEVSWLEIIESAKAALANDPENRAMDSPMVGGAAQAGVDDGVVQSSSWTSTWRPRSLMCLFRLYSIRPDIARMMEERSARTRDMSACLLLLLRLVYVTFFYINYVAEDPCDLGHFTANCASAFFHLLAFLFNLLVQNCGRLKHLRRGHAELAYVLALALESVIFAANNPLLVDAESRPLEAFTVWSWKERPDFCRYQLNLDRVVLLDAYLFNSVLALYILFVLRSGSANLMVSICFTLYTVMLNALGQLPVLSPGDKTGRHMPSSALNYVLVICNLGMMLAGKSMVERLQVKVLMELNKKGREVIEQKLLRFRAEQKLCSVSQDKKKRTNSEYSSSYDAFVFTEEELVRLKERGYEEHWLVPAENLELMVDEVLGNGCYGQVVMGELVGTPCAVKLPNKSVDSTKGIDALMNELRVFRHIRHPNIVTFHGACLDLASHPLAIVMEVVDETDLLQYMAERQSLELAADDRSAACSGYQEYHILICLCRALRYLHACRPRVVHGDLKPSNISVEATPGLPVVKLLDFGLSRVMTRRTDPFGGAFRWAAPEVMMLGYHHTSSQTGTISSHEDVGTAADVFSLGRITYLLVAGEVPLSHLNAKSLRETTMRHAIAGKRVKLEWPVDKHMVELKQLANKCMYHDPHRRSEMATLHKQVEAYALVVRASPNGVQAVRTGGQGIVRSQGIGVGVTREVAASVRGWGTTWLEHDADAGRTSRTAYSL